jgi:hypothetical protein
VDRWQAAVTEINGLHTGGAAARAFNPGVEEFSCAGTSVCSPDGSHFLQGVMAMTRRGLPEPPTIFSGAAMTMAPVGGS